MATLSLSNIRPDPDDLKAQLENFLRQKDSWRGNVDSSVGQTLLETIAAVGALDQAKIRRARQEAIPETAVSDRAIYALADFQGVRIGRKSPAHITVELNSVSAVSVPAYTQFEGGGHFFFNREALQFNGTAPVTATLYQGTVVKTTTPGLSEDYQLYFSAEAGFQVSDTDVRVILNRSQALRVTDGVWSLKFQEGFLDRTLPDGRLAIQFGTGFYGSRPGTTDVVEITYVITEGAATNSRSLQAKDVFTSSFTTVKGTFTSEPSGGTDQKPALLYKNIAAPNFGSFGSAVTKSQHLQLALSYPGVTDAQVFSQRESNPRALEWMNLIRIILLTSSAWNQTQKDAFLAYMQEHTMVAPRFFLESAAPVPVNIAAKIYCYNWADTGQVKLNVEAALTTLFELRHGSLGYDFYISDIQKAIRDSDPSIEYFEIDSPSDDLIFSSESVKAPSLSITEHVGTLQPDFYVYGVAVQTPSGFVTVKNYEYIQLTTPNSSINLSWDPVPGAIHYVVYGRSSTGTGVLATITSGTSYTDAGTVLPGDPVPPQSTVQAQYAVLNSSSISVYYSTRQARS